ncbi:MGMT family protein, partial [Ochrobactrum sp. SFR4]|nr:MGMT family protein [Ochrobactrum sp. SFR4]
MSDLLSKVPYGMVISYGELALRAGHFGSAR